MTRSAFTVFSALAVLCDKAAGGCGAAIGKRCTSKSGYEMVHCHTSRRKAADAQRTREVQGQAKPFFTPPTKPIPPAYYHNAAGRDGIFMIPSTQAPHYCRFCYRAQGHCICLDPPDFLPMREPLSPRVPDLSLDDEYRTKAVASVKAISFFPEGAKIAIAVACLEATGRRPASLRVDWSAEHATVIAHVSGIEAASSDAIMGHAIALFPVGIGVDIRIENHGPSCGCNDCEEERNQ